MLTYNNTLSVREYGELRHAVGWDKLPEKQAEAGLRHSDFLVACRDEEEAVGCARIVWDKGYIAYLADVMVRPAYQGQGIGRTMVDACISYIDSRLQEGWRIKMVVVSAKDKEPFYEKFGFIRRPNTDDGAGMQMWRTR